MKLISYLCSGFHEDLLYIYNKVMNGDIYILGIESSCDDTSAAVLRNGVLLSNVTASQAVHESYGGVVPELASRAHQQNVVPVVNEAIRRAGTVPAVEAERGTEKAKGEAKSRRAASKRAAKPT